MKHLSPKYPPLPKR